MSLLLAIKVLDVAIAVTLAVSCQRADQLSVMAILSVLLLPLVFFFGMQRMLGHCQYTDKREEV